jgi:hypothetical protein
MGVAGSGASHTVIMLTGTAGLLSGSFSMAAGEYVSMASQREMYEREISLEAQELEEKPQEERDELVLLYRAKGLPRGDAERLADQIMTDRQVALDTLTREELGLDPAELGSPLSAAISSLLTFAVGALVVILPYFAGRGDYSRRSCRAGGWGWNRGAERALGHPVGSAAAAARRRGRAGDLRHRSPDRRERFLAAPGRGPVQRQRGQPAAGMARPNQRAAAPVTLPPAWEPPVAASPSTTGGRGDVST